MVENRYRLCSIVLFVGLVLFSLCSIGDYGMSWDESFRFEGGDSKLAYYEELLSGGEPDIQSSSYPGLFDLPLAIVHNQFSDWGTRSQKGPRLEFVFWAGGVIISLAIDCTYWR